MQAKSYELLLKTSARTDIIDLTGQVQEKLAESEITSGILVVFVPGSTASVTTIEYESGVLNDLARTIERLAPEGMDYEHDLRWGDGNGYSHVRAALLKPSLSIPVTEGSLALGTWQQIVLLDFDNRPRERRVLIQILGEGV
ncbi:MAG: YjbQ family protein [Deltaproteobacteria bacterium]|nr:YjbQ family protein [Deltaproteobacteria bacterium]MBW2084825.1 YjbQ family protein [Deltaproteobacteria bacterium]